MRELTEVNKPVIAIVHFKADEAARRIIYYQVTIDPENMSAGGFIRFGRVHGDEIQGWVPEGDLVLDEVLHELDAVPYIEGMTSHKIMKDMIAA